MPQPPGTFLRQQVRNKIQFEAERSRREVAVASACTREQQLARLRSVLAQLDERELDDRRRKLAALVDQLSKGQGTTREDKTRKAVSDCIGQVREILEKMDQNATQLQRLLQTPVEPILRMPAAPATGGAELALVIMLLRLFEILVRVRWSSRR